ncbi:hypothetical protein BJ165DRAFT_861006 [Panaeolus papilionaceus]|nr:hypothetical protein BJ165DRAFT_861006 [Panaeolus papilionaceus]
MSIHSPPASVSNLLTHLAHQLLLIHVCAGLALVLHWIVSGYSVILFLLLPCAYTLLAEPSSPSFSPTFSTMSCLTSFSSIPSSLMFSFPGPFGFMFIIFFR